MTLIQINGLIKEKTKQDKILLLEQASYIACLVMNEKADKTAENIRNNILNIDVESESKKRNKWYSEICKMRGLKFPKNF